MSSSINATQFCDEAELVIQGRAVSRIRPQSNLDFTIAYTTFGLVFNLICLLLCLAFWHRYEHTRMRPLAFVILAVLSSTCLMCFAGFLIIFNDDYPCFLGPFFLCLTIPYAATCIIGRVILYTFHTQLSFATSNALKHRGGGTDLSASTLGVKSDGGDGDSIQWQITNWQWLRILSRRIMLPTTPVNNEDEFRVLKYLLTQRGIFVMVCGFTLPVSIVVIVVIVGSPDREVYWTCYNCGVSNGIIGLTIGFSLVYLSKGLMDGYMLRGSKFDMKDAWGLKRESLYSLISGMIIILAFALVQFDPAWLYPYSHAFMLCLGSWMFVASQSIVQLVIAAHRERLQARKQRTAMVNVDAQFLERVLQSEELCSKFELHLIAEFGVESLYFLKDVNAWRTSYYSVTHTTRVARAKRIFKAYVSEAGLYAVNISSKASGNVQHILENGEADVTLFDETYGEIVAMLITGSLIRFAQQNVELISVIVGGNDDEEESVQDTRHKLAFPTGMGKPTRQVVHSSLL